MQDLSQLWFLALVYWTGRFFVCLFVSQDVGWLQILVSEDRASRAEVLTVCKPSQILV